MIKLGIKTSKGFHNKVPFAEHADRATNADNADRATNADNADNADNASVASTLKLNCPSATRASMSGGTFVMPNLAPNTLYFVWVTNINAVGLFYYAALNSGAVSLGNYILKPRFDDKESKLCGDLCLDGAISNVGGMVYFSPLGEFTGDIA